MDTCASGLLVALDPQMFNVQIVGLTNAAAAGFGNMGAGVAELFMPLIQSAIADSGVSNYAAWRW